jgi:hypothetical protein
MLMSRRQTFSPQAIILHIAMGSVWSKTPEIEDVIFFFGSGNGTTRQTV